MFTNQPVAKTLDEELAEVQKLNKGFIDEPKVEDPPKPVNPPKPGNPPKEPIPPVEPPKPPEPKPVNPPAPPTPTPPAPTVPPAPQMPPEPRPPKYIPIAKYQNEKNEWKTTEERLKNEIEELKKIPQTKVDSPKEDEQIKAWAEKWGWDIEAAKEFLDMARKGQGISPEKMQELEKAAAITKNIEESNYFAEEWNKFTPDLSKNFPTATPEQVEQAAELMDKISHTPKYAAYDLDYIFFKEKAQFDAIFTPTPTPADPPAPEPKPGIEGGKIGGGKPKVLTADDFKTEKDFEKLNALDEAEKSKITSAFEPLLYDKYMRWETYTNNNALEIKRGGRTIKLN